MPTSVETRIAKMTKSGYLIYKSYSNQNYARAGASVLLKKYNTVTVIQPDLKVNNWVIYYHPNSRK